MGKWTMKCLMILVGCLLFLLCLFIYQITPKFDHLSLVYSYNKPSKRLIEWYRNQVESRRSFLAKIKSSSRNLEGWGWLYNNLAPEIHCAEPIKVGTTDDGGKWMCSPANLPLNCTVLSLGMAGDIRFEKDLYNLSSARCRTIAVDSGQQKEKTIAALKTINGIVVKTRVGVNSSSSERTIEAIVLKNGVTNVEVLKIDIEGAEFSTLEAFLDKFQVSQLMIEVHGTPFQTISLLKMIASKGYLLHHYEINGKYHNLCEYAYIHESRLEQYEATHLAKYL